MQLIIVAKTGVWQLANNNNNAVFVWGFFSVAFGFIFLAVHESDVGNSTSESSDLTLLCLF